MGDRMVDARQPRFGQAVTGLLLVGAYLLDLPTVILAVAVILGFAAVLGPRGNPYGHLFRAFRRVAGLGPPRELEEAAPPRFANSLGFAFLTVASVAFFAFHPPLLGGWLAWGLALLVSALALLAAATGLCVGCEAYVLGRRVLTRGRVSGKRVVAGPGGVRA